MSVYAVERIHQIMDCLLMQRESSLIENTVLTERVESWLCDEASKDAYRRELVFMVLRSLVGDTEALKYAGNISMRDWQVAVAKVKHLLSNAALPKLVTNLHEDHWNITHLYATTFIFEQYKYNNDVSIHNGDTVLDCGACFGETALWAALNGAKTVYAFEPNPDSFNLVVHNTQSIETTKIIPVPLALGNAPGELPFKQLPDAPGSSRLHADGNIKVPVVTLDSWCEQQSVIPDFIKMDLEGAEAGALIGAQKTIAAHKPRLAICLYHSLSDMWTIPTLIKQICPEYKFWCRKNALCVEFVLYAAVS